MKLIIYTTKYRKGGALFPRAANTLATLLGNAEAGEEICCIPVESKLELRKVFYDIEASGKTISEFHFFGHSGMYGPMFGSVAFPEQFSPWEWQTLRIPFSAEATASFHCCRSARWFAPFFAKTFGIISKGYHWYTTFSSKPSHFKAVDLFGKTKQVFCIGCPGKKSHGFLGSLKKLTGLMPAEEMKTFSPSQQAADETYNSVAAKYAEVFSDIKVREDEWNWLQQHFPDIGNCRVLDIGCGNGALLAELAPRIAFGLGIDESAQMINVANTNYAEQKNLRFEQISGPTIPLADNSVDLVISLLSFRYLDWDPMMEEIRRVLIPGGKFLVVDMVTVPVRMVELPRMFIDKFRSFRQRRKNPAFYAALSKLVTDPNWSEMLKNNPIRAQHEYVWYLESRFPGRKTEILNIGFHSRILAFDSGDFSKLKSIRLTYP